MVDETVKMISICGFEGMLCTSGSVVEYRLAKARVAGSNPVSCSSEALQVTVKFFVVYVT